MTFFQIYLGFPANPAEFGEHFGQKYAIWIGFQRNLQHIYFAKQKRKKSLTICKIIHNAKSSQNLMRSGAEVYQSCRSRQELSNERFLAKIGVDTAENEPLNVH